MVRVSLILLSGSKVACNIACRASGEELALLALEHHPPEGPANVKLLIVGGGLLDLQLSITRNGLVDGSEVTVAYSEASEKEIRTIAGKASAGQVMNTTELLLWKTCSALELYNVPPKVALPKCLKSLTLGGYFNHSLEKVTLPNGLQSLSFGILFNQSLEEVPLPAGLQSLTFGFDYNQSLEKVVLPSGLKNLTFGRKFNQSLEKVTLPSSLQSLTLGADFNHSLENVALPSSLQSLTCGQESCLSLEKTTLPIGLQISVIKPHESESDSTQENTTKRAGLSL
eukprot:TRINITY_DN4552_c0_g2_i2.p1 TRINITY_DN4552_c0_g2~~TRINITY_DN4552_c0_g2_i2.p1  ORF type:complete len:331 (+),score=55.20 TRINITY_DN4552_c0_g2_i2:143-994(+)